ncbi:unnamed protein product [Colias eurytheme]|nr:unnamed protein product [Colias eurytheme]
MFQHELIAPSDGPSHINQTADATTKTLAAGLTFMSRSGEEEPLPLMAGSGGACHSLTALARRRRRRGRSACAERPRLPQTAPTARSPHRYRLPHFSL